MPEIFKQSCLQILYLQQHDPLPLVRTVDLGSVEHVATILI